MSEQEIKRLKSMVTELQGMENVISEIINNWEIEHADLEAFMEEKGFCPISAGDFLCEARNSLSNVCEAIETALTMHSEHRNEDVSAFANRTIEDVIKTKQKNQW